MKTILPLKNCKDEFEELIKRQSFRIDLLEDFFPCLEPEDLRKIPRGINWINFSAVFKNKYPEKFYLVKDHIHWSNLSHRDDLSEKMILDLADYIVFPNLRRKLLTNTIIDLHGTKLSPDTLASYPNISVENIEKYKDYLSWEVLLKHYDASLEFVQIYFDYIGEDYLTIVALNSSDERILRTYEDLIDFSHIYHKKNLPFDLVEKGVEQLKQGGKVNWDYVRKMSNLSESFIMKYFDELTEVSTQDESKRSIYRILKKNGLLKKSERSNDFDKFLQERTKGKLGNF
jgi:predicted transcriptional regulator